MLSCTKLSYVKLCWTIAICYHIFIRHSFYGNCEILVSHIKECTESGYTNLQDKPMYSCENIITGQLRINNREILSLEASNANVGDRFKIKMQKDEVYYSYSLKHKADVFSDFAEDVYTYRWAHVGRQTEHKCYVEEANKCEENGDIPRYVNGEILDKGQGVCCACSRGYAFQSGNNYQRSNFTCNIFALLFKRGTWLSKSCPRIEKPWYSVYEISYPPDWLYTINIEISWDEFSNVGDEKILKKNLQTQIDECEENIANGFLDISTDCELKAQRLLSNMKKTYTLTDNISSLYDEDVDIKITTVANNVLSNNDPEDLSSSMILIPTFPLDDPLVMASTPSIGCTPDNFFITNPSRCDEGTNCNNPVSCLKNVLQIPNEYIDLSGVVCDKIGTSTSLWGELHGQFCESPPGTCMSNQVAHFRNLDIENEKNGRQHQYHVQDSMGMQPLFFYGAPRNTKLIVHSVETMEMSSNDSDGSQNAIDEVENNKMLLLQPSIGYMYNGEHLTTLEFQMNANEISLLRTISPAKIISIESPQSADCTMSTGGCIVKIYIWNTGTIPSHFFVKLSLCTNTNDTGATNEFDSIETVRSQVIPPNKQEALSLFLHPLSNVGSDYNCVVQLLDSRRAILEKNTFVLSIGDSKTIRYQGVVESSGLPVIKIHDPPKTSLANIWAGLINDGDGCNCGINILCFLFNISTCTVSIRAWFITILQFILVILAVIFFGPTALRLLFFIIKYISRYFRKKLVETKTKLFEQKTSSDLRGVVVEEPDDTMEYEKEQYQASQNGRCRFSEIWSIK